MQNYNSCISISVKGAVQYNSIECITLRYNGDYTALELMYFLGYQGSTPSYIYCIALNRNELDHISSDILPWVYYLLLSQMLSKPETEKFTLSTYHSCNMPLYWIKMY